jgi:hypothetical protein
MGNIGSSYFQTPQVGAQYRVTPDNYRKILGDKADVVLNPDQMKDMFKNGYLDVQRQFTEQESNEGIFTIAGKAMAAFMGPSRSIGAITIDPKFLEMIKDPNAEIGFGYTRVRQETLTSLPYPQDPPPVETPKDPEPELQQTNINVDAPEAQTEAHRDELVKFRKEQEERTETTGTPESYMVERNSGQNNGDVKWSKDGGAKDSSEFGTLVKEFEADGAPQYWNTEYVQDATWEGAYVEAALQDRKAAVGFQYATRGNTDMNTAVADVGKGPAKIKAEALAKLPENIREKVSRGKALSEAETKSLTGDQKTAIKDFQTGTTVAMRQTEKMLGYINKKNPGSPPLTMQDAVKNPGVVRDKMAKAYGFGSFGDVQTIATHSKDFRAIGYLSGENPKVATAQIAQLTKGEANGILSTQITGRSTKIDGTANFYDTIGMLKSRSTSETGFDVYQSNPVKDGETLLDVYRNQTETTSIPDNALGDYTKLYNTTFGTNLSESEIKAADPKLKDMYALRAHDFYQGDNSVGVSPSNGRVTLKNSDSIDRVLNVRLVLEANNGKDQVHRFGSDEIKAVNGRVAKNFAHTTLNLHDNLGNVTTKDNASTIHRLQITSEDSEAIDTAKLELNRTGVLKSPSGEILATFAPEAPVVSDSTDAVKNAASDLASSLTGTQKSDKPTENPRVLKDAQGNVIPPEKHDEFLAGIVEKFKVQGNAKKEYSSALDGGVGYGYVGGTGAPKVETHIKQTPEVKVKASEMLALANGTADTGKVDELKASLGITGEITQPELFTRVLTEAFGQTDDQAKNALTAATAPQGKSFSFPAPPTSASPNGVKFSPPVDGDPSLVHVDESTSPGGISKEAREKSLGNNLNTMGQLTQVTPLIPSDKEAVKNLKTQILADIEALQKDNPNGTAMINGKEVNLSTLKADVESKFTTIDANVAKGDEAVKALAIEKAMGQVAEGEEPNPDEDAARNGLPPGTPQEGQFRGMPGIPAVSAGKSPSSPEFQKSVQDSVKSFAGQLRQMVSDGDISTGEQAKINSWVSTSKNNLATSLDIPQEKLFGNDPEGALRAKGITEPGDIAAVMQSVNIIKEAQASVNTTKEAGAFHTVLDGVRNLQQKVKEFNTIGVARNAFVGEMKELAKDESKFDETIRGAYKLPEKGVSPKADAVCDKLLNAAKEGSLPLPPSIAFVSPDVIKGANAAYLPEGKDGPTIVLSRDLLNRPGDLRNALAEEMFHHLEKEVQDFRPGDTEGDEGHAGMMALRAAQQGQDLSGIRSAAEEGSRKKAEGVANLDEALTPAKSGDKLVEGFDHGTVTINGVAYKAEFQSASGNDIPAQTAPAADPYADTGLSVRPNNPHATGQEFVDPSVSPVEQARRDQIKTLQTQIGELAEAEKKGPLSGEQRNQKQQLEARLNEVRGMTPAQFEEKYKAGPAADSTSSHQIEAAPDDFWGKAKDMGGQALNGLLTLTQSGKIEEFLEKLAQGIEAAWKPFLSSKGNQFTSQAEDVVQSGFDVGRDGNYNAGRTNLIDRGPMGVGNTGGQDPSAFDLQQRVARSTQEYNSKFRQAGGKSALAASWERLGAPE